MSDTKTVGRPTLSTDPKQARENQRYQARRLLGLCGWCGADGQGRALCPKCSEISTRNQRAMRERRQAADQCRECGAPARGQARCEACNQIRNLRPSRQPGMSGWKGGGR